VALLYSVHNQGRPTVALFFPLKSCPEISEKPESILNQSNSNSAFEPEGAMAE
jgi:hypothetical protein